MDSPLRFGFFLCFVLLCVVIAFRSIPSPVMASGSGTALKIIILGKRGYVVKKFHEQYVATYGALFVTKEILIGDAPVTLQIWDTAGQDRFRSFCTPFYRLADCCILLYDVNVGNSFDTLDSWHDALFNQMNSQDRPLDLLKLPLILLGNKVDVDRGKRRVVWWRIVN
ncbi:unnamed protein product [Musa acuminata subsp. burmannicoides]